MTPTVSLLRTALNATSYAAPALAGRLAYRVFDRPPHRSRIRPQEEELMRQAVTTHLVVNGGKVVVHQWGDGSRPVLLVHGWAARASWFAGFVRALRGRGYTAIAFDAPGHGASEGRSTTAFEYREIIGRLHAEHGEFEAVVAHSFGVLSTFLALHDGVRARRFVGLAGLADFGHVVDGFCARLGLRDRIRDEMRRHIADAVLPGEHRVWQQLDTAYRAEELDLPILLVHDRDDDMMAVEQSRRTAQAHPGIARLVVTEGLGHRRVLGDPHVVAAAMEFLAGRDASAPMIASASEVLG